MLFNMHILSCICTVFDESGYYIPTDLTMYPYTYIYYLPVQDRLSALCNSVEGAGRCDITVIQGKELEEKGMGGIWGVGKVGMSCLATKLTYQSDCFLYTIVFTDDTGK